MRPTVEEEEACRASSLSGLGLWVGRTCGRHRRGRHGVYLRLALGSPSRGIIGGALGPHLVEGLPHGHRVSFCALLPQPPKRQAPTPLRPTLRFAPPFSAIFDVRMFCVSEVSRCLRRRNADFRLPP